jgi:hypothetical protein
MKIRITKDGLFGAGPIPVGSEFVVNGLPPAGWAGKYEIVSDDPAPEAVPVINPETPRRGRPRKDA